MTNPKMQIHVVVDPVNHAGFVSGWRGKELVTRCGGRAMWSRSRGAWATSEATATDVVAAAEADGCNVTVTTLGGDE